MLLYLIDRTSKEAIYEQKYANIRSLKNLLKIISNGKLIMMSALELECCYEFACHVGAMQRVIEKCVKYADERKRFNTPISKFQAVTHKIA